jgi:hypothetical protein
MSIGKDLTSIDSEIAQLKQSRALLSSDGTKNGRSLFKEDFSHTA